MLPLGAAAGDDDRDLGVVAATGFGIPAGGPLLVSGLVVSASWLVAVLVVSARKGRR